MALDSFSHHARAQNPPHKAFINGPDFFSLFINMYVDLFTNNSISTYNTLEGYSNLFFFFFSSSFFNVDKLIYSIIIHFFRPFIIAYYPFEALYSISDLNLRWNVDWIKRIPFTLQQFLFCWLTQLFNDFFYSLRIFFYCRL